MQTQPLEALLRWWPLGLCSPCFSPHSCPSIHSVALTGELVLLMALSPKFFQQQTRKTPVGLSVVELPRADGQQAKGAPTGALRGVLRTGRRRRQQELSQHHPRDQRRRVMQGKPSPAPCLPHQAQKLLAKVGPSAKGCQWALGAEGHRTLPWPGLGAG